MRTSLQTYLHGAISEEPTTPVLMDESSIFLFLSGFTKEHILSYEELIEASISQVYTYDIPEDKKEFNIETVRRCIIDIELRPYEWKNIYILRHFDTATIQAQNALLKILEECPPYAIIILEVENANMILDTIRSRTIDLTERSKWEGLSPLWTEIIEAYKKRDHNRLAELLYGSKCTSNEAISILQWVYPYLAYDDMLRCDEAIEALASTHENPRSILDIFFM